MSLLLANKTACANLYKANLETHAGLSLETLTPATLDLLYAHVFSYDGILDPLSTGFAMVSALYGLDCQNQLQHHMKGMLFNGARRDDLVELQQLCLGIAKELGVTFRHGPAPIPTIPTQSGDDSRGQKWQ